MESRYNLKNKLLEDSYHIDMSPLFLTNVWRRIIICGVIIVVWMINVHTDVTDEQLEAVSGGGCFGTAKCDKCGSKKVKLIKDVERSKYKCEECGNVFIRKPF